MNIVIMAGHPLPLVPDYTASFVPTAESMQHYNLVPESALWDDGRDVRNSKRQPGDLFCDEGFDGDRLVGIQG
jgi:hypothetical protein